MTLSALLKFKYQLHFLSNVPTKSLEKLKKIAKKIQNKNKKLFKNITELKLICLKILNKFDASNVVLVRRGGKRFQFQRFISLLAVGCHKSERPVR